MAAASKIIPVAQFRHPPWQPVKLLLSANFCMEMGRQKTGRQSLHYAKVEAALPNTGGESQAPSQTLRGTQ